MTTLSHTCLNGRYPHAQAACCFCDHACSGLMVLPAGDADAHTRRPRSTPAHLDSFVLTHRTARGPASSTSALPAPAKPRRPTREELAVEVQRLREQVAENDSREYNTTTAAAQGNNQQRERRTGGGQAATAVLAWAISSSNGGARASPTGAAAPAPMLGVSTAVEDVDTDACTAGGTPHTRSKGSGRHGLGGQKRGRHATLDCV